MHKEFQFEKVKSWVWMVVMVTHNVNALNCTLKNGNFYVVFYQKKIFF